MESIAFPIGCLLVAAGLAMVRFWHPGGPIGWLVVAVCVAGIGLQVWALYRRHRHLRRLTTAFARRRGGQR